MKITIDRAVLDMAIDALEDAWLDASMGKGDMAKHRFARCNLNPRWSYFPPLHSCKSYSPAEPQIIKARKAWEAK